MISKGPTESVRVSQEMAEQAELRYVTAAMPGIQRRRCGGGFTYVDAKGCRISEASARQRIAALAIPPAWTDVWICPLRNGHLQATGRDDRGRKQYVYHERWRDVSNRTKFERMLSFGEALPKIRRQMQGDIGQTRDSRRRVLAAVVNVLDRALIRVGSRDYAEENESFGATTLTRKHVEVDGSKIRFRFRGKGGKYCDIELYDRRLARVLNHCEEIPGQELFQYYNGDGEYRPVESADVNAYLQEITGESFTAKDFRTWHGSALAAGFLAAESVADEAPPTKKRLDEAICYAADELGNTPAICRKYYVHPRLAELYLSGQLPSRPPRTRRRDARLYHDRELLLLHILRG